MQKIKIYINFDTVEKVKDFATIMSQNECESFVKSGYYIVDGKSILGLLSLNLNKKVTVLIKAEPTILIKILYDLANVKMFNKNNTFIMYANINTLDKVRRFGTISNNSQCDVKLKSRKYYCDGKSILSILTLNLTGPIQIIATSDDFTNLIWLFRDYVDDGLIY